MKNRLFLRGMSLILFALLSVTFSCQNDVIEIQEDGKVTIKPLTDERIKAEILAMVNGTFQTENGRTNNEPPVQLPSGYDYNNMEEVYISGTNWTTYVAYSTTQNTSTFKKMIGIYYDDNGAFKNFMHTEWKYNSGSHGPPYSYKYLVPESYPQYYTKWKFDPETDVVLTAGRMRAPSECGGYIIDCIDSFYTGRGWLSVGIFLATLAYPPVGVGVIGGCMLSCAAGL